MNNNLKLKIMKVTIVRKKVNHCKSLLDEHTLISATFKCIEKTKKESGYKLEDPVYISNMQKRLVKIEEVFDHLLK